MTLMKPAIATAVLLLAWTQQSFAAEACVVRAAAAETPALKTLIRYRAVEMRAVCIADTALSCCGRDDRSHNYSLAQPCSSPATLGRLAAMAK